MKRRGFSLCNRSNTAQPYWHQGQLIIVSDSWEEVRQFIWFTRHPFVWCRLYLQYVLSDFFQPSFRCPSKAGQVSLGRLVDSYPGDSIHQRGYFLHCFLSNTSLDFLLPWALGCHTCWFVVNRHSYTDRTAQPQDVTYCLYFVWVSDKKAGEHSGHLGKIFHPLLEEQKHLILGGQIS